MQKVISFQDYQVNLIKNLSTIEEWISLQNYSQYFVLVDENTKRDCLPKLSFLQDFEIIEIKSGEINKNLATCQNVWQSLLEKNADRNTLLINLGGGVISDLGGFCAAAYKRGIDFINIPTTLLAQVDATVGGKTGIDFLGQKNMIGLFQFPKAVFVANTFLQTLEAIQIKSGEAEMLKHGLIADENYFNILLQNKSVSEEMIAQSIQIKKEIVLADVYEQNERKKLNFGHTIGHAIESYSLQNDKKPLLHGEAIAQGMIYALELSSILSGLSKEKSQDCIAVIKRKYSDYQLSREAIDFVLEAVRNDKKNLDNQVKMVLLQDIGSAVVDIAVDIAQIKAILSTKK